MTAVRLSFVSVIFRLFFGRTALGARASDADLLTMVGLAVGQNPVVEVLSPEEQPAAEPDRLRPGSFSAEIAEVRKRDKGEVTPRRSANGDYLDRMNKMNRMERGL